ncbi:ABC transporter substrate-binding protein [Anaeromyxobacter oryzisoli]|uniref:ABC transporter substrate-binding protein n=1 Tax=Anaeromyxobacter oryzisoli TaxID=2925408 RepID=UPI001F55FB5B|nr:ABC transporter substrate binding protein [Anaeromyxobacter sp. SG63]
MIRLLLRLAPALLALSTTTAQAAPLAGKKVLFVNSYHEGYPWSDGEEKGARAAFAGSGVELRFIRMDLKRHPDDAFRNQAADKARAEIEAYRPDVVVVADDPAVRYVLEDHYKNARLPFVFCGVNWDASKYGLPYKNATGIVEVAPVKELLKNLRAYAKGSRIGYLTVDSETERIENPHYKKTLGITFAKEKFAKTFAEWKQAFLEMQRDTDMIFLGNVTGIQGWNEAEAKAFVAANTKVPSATAYDFMMPYAMLGFTKIEEEQGAYAATTALRILKGEAPSAIPVATNKQSKIFMNLKLAKAAGIVFAPGIVRNAQVVQ